jgi:phosphatidylglycerol:prolipoprotein diacylglycerol transferase
MKPILIQLGPFPISSFGLFLLLAFLVGIAVARRRGRAVGIDPSRMLDIALYMIIGGIVVGRLGYVAVNFPAFARAPLTIVTIWKDSGLTFYGALAGGLIVAAIYARAFRVPFSKFIDVFAPALVLGYAVAMVGALLHGLYIGRPTGVPWGVQMFLDRRHPTQIYLMLGALGTYTVLRAQEKLQPPPGTLFFLWLLLHAVSRVAVEFFVESPPVLGKMFTLAQVVNAAAAVIALVGLLLISRARAPEPPVQPAAPPEMPPAV